MDARPVAGSFILSGSANFSLLQSLGQSLAGRTALLELLPLSLQEVRRFPAPPADLFDLLWRGSYPAVYDRSLEPGDWYPSYVSTYLERDVRALLNVGDLVAFQTCLKLCAGRVGQLVKVRHLAAAAVPRPCRQAADQDAQTPLPGFGARVLSARDSFARPPAPAPAPRFDLRDLGRLRDREGAEVDLVVDLGHGLIAVETKSGQTVAPDFFAGLETFTTLIASGRPRRAVRSLVVYGGGESQRRSRATVVPWSSLDRQVWWDTGD